MQSIVYTCIRNMVGVAVLLTAYYKRRSLIMYPKGSSLGCLKKLSVASGIFHVISSVFTGCCGLVALALTGFLALSGPALLSMTSMSVSSDVGIDALLAVLGDTLGAVFGLGVMILSVVVGVVALACILFFVLNVRRATTHLGRNKMLKLYPSDSGLRVYRYQLVWTIFGLLWATLVLVGIMLGSEVSVPAIVVGCIPFVSMVFDLITWIYTTVKFDKLMGEMVD